MDAIYLQADSTISKIEKKEEGGERERDGRNDAVF